jgi:hypothetical protein
MNKVLTLRTQNLIINSTQFTYSFVILNPHIKNRNTKYMLKPGDAIPFLSENIESKICIKCDSDEEYSDFIAAKKLIFDSAILHTVS